jgi:hypothetical protein
LGQADAFLVKDAGIEDRMDRGDVADSHSWRAGITVAVVGTCSHPVILVRSRARAEPAD